MSESEDVIRLVQNTGKYQIISENNEGANAYAFVAKHIPLDREVFLKIYATPRDEPTIFNEPKILLSITDGNNGGKNLIRVFDAEKLNDEYALIAMEYISGGSLRRLLPLPLAEALTCCTGILLGLGILHNDNILHRDIKPDNIVMVNSNSKFCPKLADFGSAVKVQQKGELVTASRHSALYVPPEGWNNPSIYDNRSDIYQVGLVLYEMLHGPLPITETEHLDSVATRELKSKNMNFSELDRFEQSKMVDESIKRRCRSGKLRNLRRHIDYVPKCVMRIVNKAMNINPDKRYQQVSEMISDIENLTLPNWKIDPNNPNNIIALDWHRFDWIIQKASDNKTCYRTIRAKHGTSKYRKWGESTALLNDACNLVGNCIRKRSR